MQKTSLSTGRPGSFSSQPRKPPVRSAGNDRLYRQPVFICNPHVPGDYRSREGNSQKIPAPDPPPLPKITGQGGCPPELLPPPSPRFSFFVNRPHLPGPAKNVGTTPHAFQSPKVCFAWSVRRAGEGTPPLQCRTRGVGGSHEGEGWPLCGPDRVCPPPTCRTFSCAGPLSPGHAKRGGVGVGLEAEGYTPNLVVREKI